MNTDGLKQVCKMPRALKVKIQYPRMKGSSYFSSKWTLQMRFPLPTHPPPQIGTDVDV